jgi:hypothetical protein
MLSACSGKGTPRKPDAGAASPLAFAEPSPSQLRWRRAPDALEAERAWSRKTGGPVVDLDVSADGGTVLASTIPDFESPGGLRKHAIHGYSADGKVNFSKVASAPVKAQALSSDGSLAFVSAYDDSLAAYSRKGKRLWRVDAICRPVPLNRLKRVLCFHDDDAEPEVAFEVLDWKTGRRLAAYPIESDVLGLELSPDERGLGLSLAGGWIHLFDPKLRLAWKKRLPGEIVDFSISEGASPRVAAVTSDGTIWLLGPDGAIEASGRPATHVEQVAILPDASAIVASGNGKQGQVVLSVRRTGDRLAEAWSQGDPLASQYNAPLIGGSRLTTVRFEGSGGKASDTRILAFDSEGVVRWSAKLGFGEGMSLYARSSARPRGGTGLLVLSTEDGRLEALRFRER